MRLLPATKAIHFAFMYYHFAQCLLVGIYCMCSRSFLLCGGRIVFNILNQFLFYKTSNYCLLIKGHINLLNFNFWPNFLIFSTRPDMLKTRNCLKNQTVELCRGTYCIYECVRSTASVLTYNTVRTFALL